MLKNSYQVLKFLCNEDIKTNNTNELYNLFIKKYKNFSRQDWDIAIDDLKDIVVTDDKHEVLGPKHQSYIELKRYEENHKNMIQGIVVDAVEEAIKASIGIVTKII